jgi:hypothetical protein
MNRILSLLVLAIFVFAGCEPEKEVIVEIPPRFITHSGSGSQTSVVSGENIVVSVQGTGTLTLSGTSNFAEITLNSAGTFIGSNLEIKAAEVNHTGSGSIYIWVTDILNVKIQGSGSVYYKGNPIINSNVQGSGKLVKL